MRKVRSRPAVAGVLLVVGALVGGLSSPGAAATRVLLARGGHISGVARPEARGAAAGVRATGTTCITPGNTNYIADCNSTGRPTNETSIAYNGDTFVAGANDYNSYNGNADLGYYTSTDGKAWTDNGPLDLFAEGDNHAAGDPGLAIDLNGVAYYSGIYFDYFDCNIGGVELARRDPNTGTWSYYQIRANSDLEFQDKPAIMQDQRHVYVSWTKYGSCTGVGVTSPIVVAVFKSGPTSGPPVSVLKVPGSTYSQGSAMTSDNRGGFWITWEEFSDAFDTTGEIKLVHWTKQGGFTTPRTISPPGFTDLPSPLPGFSFRDNSFPAITLGGGKPKVVWTSYDSGKGRAYLWSNGVVKVVSDTGGDQFFPAVTAIDFAVLAISYSQTDQASGTYDRYLVEGSTVLKISTESSFPNNDPFFGGTFIGDYEGIATAGTVAHPIWTDIRAPTYAQNAMVYSP